MTFGTFVVSMAIFGGVTSLLWLILNRQSHYESQIDNRLAGLAISSPMTVNKINHVAHRKPRDGAHKSRQSRFPVLWIPDKAEERQRLQTRLMNAGIYSPLAPSIYVTVKMILAILPPVVGLVAGSMDWLSVYTGVLTGSLVGIMGLFVPSFWLSSQKRRWHATIGRSLADFLDLMVACLEVGLSAEAALQRVTDELRIAHPRLAMELSVVQTQIELGASSDTALTNFADRSDNDAIRALAAVVQQGRRLGGGMADVFRQQAESLRVRRELIVEEKAQQAAVKILAPTLLFIFPVIFVVLAGPAVVKLQKMFGDESRPMRIGKSR